LISRNVKIFILEDAVIPDQDHGNSRSAIRSKELYITLH